MNAGMLAGLALGAVALAFGRAHDHRKLLEGARERYRSLLAGDVAGEARAQLELDAARIARAIREVPDIEASRLTFIDSTDPFPYIAAGEIGVLENFLAPREMVRREFGALLDDALEHYRAAERRALNPVSWFGVLLFLPRELLEYLGLYSARTARMATWLQILWWVTGIVAVGALLVRVLVARG